MLPLLNINALSIGQAMTSLERIVATRSIGHSFMSHVYSEVSVEKNVLGFINLSSPNIWIFSTVAIVIYGQYKFNEGAKFKQFVAYDKYNTIIREILMIILLIFTRDVENAI